jgi:hypothetical protein
VEVLEQDLKDGYLLVQLLEIISAKDLPKHKKHPKIRAQQLENAASAITFIKDEGIKVCFKGHIIRFMCSHCNRSRISSFIIC